jgi:hypothetical protein
MRTASRNPERWLRLAALFSLVLAMAACGSSTDLNPTPTNQPAHDTQAAPATGAPTTQPAFPADACFTDILPGSTSRDDVVRLLGEPTTTYSEDTKENLGYPSFIAGMDDFLVIENNLLVLASKLMEPAEMSLTRLKELLGEPEKITYSNFMMGTQTYLYPQQGLTFIVETESDQVLFQECSVPMSLDDYMTKWGAELPLEDPFTE